MQALQTPEVLHFKDGAFTRFGGNQLWYKKHWQRLAGCGPTTAANLLYYIGRTRDTHRALAPALCPTRDAFLLYMEEIWRHVTPGLHGTDMPMLVDGALAYGREKGIILTVDALAIPEDAAKRPSPEQLLSFIEHAIENDIPVAFRNKDSGKLSNLDNWHWVLLVGCDAALQTARMYDQGNYAEIHMGEWVATTRKGGEVVAIW